MGGLPAVDFSGWPEPESTLERVENTLVARGLTPLGPEPLQPNRYSIELFKPFDDPEPVRPFVRLSASWLDGETEYTLPDFTALPGFDPEWGYDDVTSYLIFHHLEDEVFPAGSRAIKTVRVNQGRRAVSSKVALTSSGGPSTAKHLESTLRVYSFERFSAFVFIDPAA